MTKRDETAEQGRRDFLKMSATAAPLAAVAMASGASTAEAAEPDFSKEEMQDTAHTRAFYETARF
ncbi:twin-arginine translocation signal domain-containing protein [Roseobacteraceae bacterium S113]